MDLFLLRHGEAGKRLPAGGKDRERGLTEAGKEEMRSIARALSSEKFEFDVIATSPLRRAKETAAIVNRGLNRKSELEEWPELQPEANEDAFYRRLSKFKADSSVLCVGHEPFLTNAVAGLIARESEERSGIRILLKKGGLAKISISGASVKGGGELRWLLTPKQIRKMA